MRVRVVVAPLLSGAGVKGKVNQAMKYGTPMVTTPLAVEGMYASDGVDCMVATSPQGFADKVLQVRGAAAVLQLPCSGCTQLGQPDSALCT